MFTTGSKWLFGIAGAAVVAALVYGGATNPSEVGMSTFTGVLTLGYKGGVGDHIGYSILMAIAGAAIFLGATTAAFRDSDSDALAEVLGHDEVPALATSERGSPWPVIGAFGAAVVVVGLATSSALVGFGAFVLAAVILEWGLSAWADRVSDDEAVNQAARRRVTMPLEVPILGALGVAVFVLAFSRVLLAVPSVAVYFIFGGLATIVLILAFVLSSRPRIDPSLVAAIGVVGALAVIGGGVASAAVGPREIEHHDTEEHESAPAPSPATPGSVR